MIEYCWQVGGKWKVWLKFGGGVWATTSHISDCILYKDGAGTQQSSILNCSLQVHSWASSLTPRKTSVINPERHTPTERARSRPSLSAKSVCYMHPDVTMESANQKRSPYNEPSAIFLCFTIIFFVGNKSLGEILRHGETRPGFEPRRPQKKDEDTGRCRSVWHGSVIRGCLATPRHRDSLTTNNKQA